MAKVKETCTTFAVTDALTACDDFLDLDMLVQRTGKTRKQIQSALWMLLRYRAVGVEVNADGKGWWYARPEEDTRLTHPVERVPETKPRKVNPRRKQ